MASPSVAAVSVTSPGGDLLLYDMGRRPSVLGEVTYIKICAPGYRSLGWREVWERFASAYPGRWAVQCFPPADRLVDGKAMYHLFVLDCEPGGLDIR
jgi:hypothetical protein